MKRIIITLSLIAIAFVSAQAQKLTTRTGYVKFYSEAALENIEAETKQVSSIIDTEKGTFAFLVPIKSFVFEKALMQEHFNENYMESDVHPKASFTGTITNINEIDFSKEGSYEAKMSGKMNIHGIGNQITQSVNISVSKGEVELNCTFNIKPESYGVKIPASKKDNISEVIEVTVKMNYEK